MPERMRVLTLWAEWYLAFVVMNKTVENRTWPPPANLVDFHLHAGASWPGPNSARWESFCETARLSGYECHNHGGGLVTVNGPGAADWDIQVPLGHIFARVHLGIAVRYKDFVGSDSWAFGPWCWLLSDVGILKEPIPAKGHQGLWWWDQAA